VEHFKPDVVHLNSSTLAMAALGVHQTGTPMVWHIREPLARGYLGLRRRWLRNVIDRTADRVVSISNSDAARLKASDRIRVIYNFVDLTQFDRALTGTNVRDELGLDAADRVVVMLGGAARPKGTTVFIKALPYVLERHPNAFFLIAGPPPKTLDEGGVKGVAKRLLGADAYKRRVLRLLDQVDTQGRLMFTGIRQDIPHILAMSEMLVFSSTVPHFARPVIEASAMGKPAIASNLGGPAELIVDGETGLLVPPANPAALADAICTLLDDPALANKMGDAGYNRALAHFNAEINARNTLALYDEITADDQF
jgi:glycosyltransferase involved in cell wall biosynthesis